MNKTITKFILGLMIIGMVLLISYIKQIDTENDGHDYFGFQVCSFFGFENIRKEWGINRDIDFQFYPEDLEFDSVSVEINNNSLGAFHTLSFPEKMPVLFIHDVICIDSKCDTITGNPYGCGTGMYLRKVEDKRLTENWKFDLKEEIEYYVQDSPIPDSIILQKSLLTFELPWSIYKASEIYSTKLVLVKEDIKEILDKGNSSK